MMDVGWRFVWYGDQQDRPQLTRALLLRVARYARPYAVAIVGLLATILGVSLLALVPPLLMRELIDRALPDGDAALLNLLALGMVAVPLLSGLLGVLQRHLSASVGEGLIYDLRCSLYDHLQRMSLRFFTSTKSGELLSRLNNDVVGAQQAITGTLVTVLSNAVAVFSTLAVMLTLEWRLTLLGCLVLPLLFLPAQRVAGVLRRLRRESMDRNAQMNALVGETLHVSGALLVKLFGRANRESQRFAENAARVRDIGVRQAVIGRWFFLGLSLTGAVGTALVFWLGGHLVLRGEFSVGTIVAFGTYLTQLYGPLMGLTNARVELATSLVSFERVFEMLDLPLEIRERPDARRLPRAEGHIQFERVSFSYQEQPEPVAPAASGQEQIAERNGPAARRRWALRDVSFEVRPGQLAALVGPSGAGKTTVTYLLPRLYDPTFGRILLDGHDLRDLSLDSLTGNIAMVTQETYVFHDTVRANLLYARPDATQTELDEACRAANLHELILGLPEGYETVVGERGYRLSGGEKQRLAIARAVLKDPRILVLDEATSHLDSHSEALIQAALERLMLGRTSLVIAHRLSTVLAADVILVLDRGRLAEHGTHAELLTRDGLYARLFRTQFRGFMAEPTVPSSVSG
jgi:ATP-binding cassette subfamily B protein